MADLIATSEPDTKTDTSAGPQTAHDPAEGVLRAQYHEIAQLAGGLAHEIRNPLSTMRLNLDLLAEEFQTQQTARDQRVYQRIERLRRETDRLGNILEDFLRFARLQDLQIAPADLNEVVGDLHAFCEPMAASQNVVIRTHFATNLDNVLIDIDVFKQALLNLMLNALHAMPDGGELILRTSHDAGWAVLDVIDTGCGIPAELHAKVFEAFFSTRPGGSGLGLPTTRRIIEAHGGTLSLQSEPGKGSRFTIRLPLSQ